jgi:glycosyltransferase involved in cell wall biosynthesis
LIGKWQHLKTKKHEQELWNKLDKTFFISDLDYRQAINFIKTPEKAAVLYDSFAGKKITDQPIKEEKSLLFSGSLKTFQNVINLENFLDEIMLKLLKKDKSWKLYITANNKLNLKKEFKIDQVINAGFVEDIDRYTIQKKYFISPTIMGSGVRIKILNAMALGMVCFISKLDYESMDYFVDMENVVQYSDFEEFYQKLMHLESTPADYDKISDNALKVHQDLTWHKYMNNVLASIGA